MITDDVMDHDVKPGPLTRCQISGSEELFEVIDLGCQPPCDSLLGPDDLGFGEVSYPLALNLCPESGLAQLSFSVPGEELYPPQYPYRAGISRPVVDHQRGFAEQVAVRYAGTAPNPLVVDIGSNDGTLLVGFKQRGLRVLGVEPTDVARIAEHENGIATIQAFFTEAVAKDVVVEFGRARIVTMTNVFAHMSDLGEVMRGLLVLLDRDSVFVTESHYLGDILSKLQFDTIYHEHLRTYSLKAIRLLVEQYGLRVIDVERVERYGGNIRAYIARRDSSHVVWPGVAELLEREEKVGLFDYDRWARWRGAVNEQRHRMLEWLHAARGRGESVVGCSAPGRASTLINYYGLKPCDIEYTGELATSLKLGKYLPGSRIPVVSNRRLIDEQPDNVILFSWHYADVIVERLRREGYKGRLVRPLPTFQEVS